jgi:hypothetical protein
LSRTPALVLRRRPWLYLALLVVLLAGHGVILHYVASHLMLSAVVLLGLIVLLVIRHLGTLGAVYTLFRQRRSRTRPDVQ